jgi:transposase-like protein
MSSPTQGPYDPEFRARAVELVRTCGLPRAQVVRDLGINVDTLRLWVKQAGVLREEREILKQAARLFAMESVTR